MTPNLTLDRMPQRETYGHERLTTLDHLLHNYQKIKAGELVSMTSASRQVLGYGLPSWQRGQVWSPEQCERFITSAWQGRPLGTWMVNTIDTAKQHALDGLILDGQQRLFAIECYFKDEIAVPDKEGNLLHWSEMTTRERRRFGGTVFAHLEIHITDEVKLQQIYDAHNFGGIAHQAHERAVGASLDTMDKPSASHNRRSRSV